MTPKRTLFFSILLGSGAGFVVVACTLAPNPDLPYTDSGGKGDGVTDNGDDGGLDPGHDGNSASGGSGATGGQGGAGGEGGTSDED